MAKAGFTLLETLIALAVLALVAALATTRVSVALEQMATHVAFQDLQTQATALRLRAFREAEPQTLDLSTALVLRPGWSARSQAPLAVEADGACASSPVELLHGDVVRARLAPADGACRFARMS